MRCTRVLILIGILAYLSACASTVSDAPYSMLEQSQPLGFETPPIFEADQLLPSYVIYGQNYSIDQKVQNNGYHNVYRIISDYGFYEAKGDYQLKKLIKEIEAISTMRHIASSREFKAAVKSSAKAPLTAVKDVVLNPFKTLIGIPVGTYKFARRFSTLLSEDRSHYEDSRTKELIGFSKVKRQYAHVLGVDVFSQNKQLQEHLNHISWITFTASIPVRVAYSFAPHAAGITLSSAYIASDMRDNFLSATPEDLRYQFRNQLTSYGFDIETINRFVGHQWLSPRHQTGIISSLKAMDGVKGVDGIISLASTTKDEETSLFLQNTLELLARYHQEYRPIKMLHTWNDLVLGHTKDDRLVVAIPADYLSWTKHNAESFSSIIERIAKPLNVKNKTVVINGQFSKFARRELTKQQWATLPDFI